MPVATTASTSTVMPALRYRDANAAIEWLCQDYSSREFTVKDPEGHSWCVGTYNPWTMQAS